MCAAVLVFLAIDVLKSSVFYVELGGDVPYLPNDYLFGLLISNDEIDVSGVDSEKVGTYNSVCEIFFRFYDGRKL